MKPRAGPLGLALLAASGILLVACTRTVPREPGPTAAKDPAAVLFVTASLEGTLEPCGCSASLRGGLARTAQVIASARAEGHHASWIDAGNAFFPSANASSEGARPQERARAITLAGAMATMELAARVNGPLDRSDGDGASLAARLPTMGAHEARLVGAPAASVPIVVVTGTTREALQAAIDNDAAPRNALRIALVPVSLEQALALDLEALGIGLVVASGTGPQVFESATRIVVQGGLPHVSIEGRGRALLRVDIAAPAPGERGRPRWQPGEDDAARELAALDARIALLAEELDRPGAPEDPLRPLKRSKAIELQARRAQLANAPLRTLTPGHFSLRVVPVDPTLPEEPRVAALVAAQNAEIGALNLAWAREHGEDCPPPADGEASFVGNAACLDCHPEAAAVWTKTRHAHAWETLEKIGKQHHLDCIGCHVVGWQEPGGVCRVDRTEGKEDVGCESCHGPGSRHAETGDVKLLRGRADEARCRTCHNAEHSPHFDFATWLPRVLGPGHGKR